ncbi:MAG: hypothetical protein Q4D86_07025 [Pasteurella oralis]|uniref:hypothetical protein n=1 Tax=Pasteurella oralis TaxID=1071947 RepID=UPI0026FF4E54|nr:hypothetical protein [Pasteurella oralis]
MEKSILKVSLLVGLSTLFTACSGSNGSESPSSKTPSTQSIPQNSQQPENGKKQTHSNNSDTNKEQITPPQSNNNDKNATNDLSNNQENPEQSPHAKKESSNQNNSNGVEKTPQNNLTEKQNSEKINANDPNNRKQENPVREKNKEQPKKESLKKSNENPTKQQNNKLEQLQKNESTSTHWNGKCESGSICNNISLDPNSVTVYKTEIHPAPKDSKYEITVETPQTITLKTGENTDSENKVDYKFFLLQENNSVVAYYGHRARASEDKTNTHIELLYAVKDELINKTKVPMNFIATYSRKNGFIYAPYSTSTPSNNRIKKYADVSLSYKDGNVTGKITDTNDKNTTLFDITGKEAQLIITSKEAAATALIPAEEKAIFDIQFIDSQKNTNDRKYIVGAGKGTSNDTWIGLLFAEKQNNTH